MYSYEIIEIYRVILDELKAALRSHESHDDKHQFYINPTRIAGLLRRQASNLEILDQLSASVINEIVILDSRFEQTFRQITPGKAGILFDAQFPLSDGRIPLNEDDAHHFPAAADSTYRTLWFTRDTPKQDRQEIRKYLYGWTGTEKKVVDVNIHDGDKFFRLLSWYFENNRPYVQLENL